MPSLHLQLPGLRDGNQWVTRTGSLLVIEEGRIQSLSHRWRSQTLASTCVRPQMSWGTPGANPSCCQDTPSLHSSNPIQWGTNLQHSSYSGPHSHTLPSMNSVWKPAHLPVDPGGPTT